MSTQLIAKEEIKLRATGESYHRTYPVGFKFNVISFSNEHPTPLMARVVLPDGKKHSLSLYKNDYSDRTEWISRFDIKKD